MQFQTWNQGQIKFLLGKKRAKTSFVLAYSKVLVFINQNQSPRKPLFAKIGLQSVVVVGYQK